MLFFVVNNIIRKFKNGNSLQMVYYELQFTIKKIEDIVLPVKP